MMPRTDGIFLGGTSEHGVWTLEPNEEERTRVVQAHIELFKGMRAPGTGIRAAHAGTPREVPSLESHFWLES